MYKKELKLDEIGEETNSREQQTKYMPNNGSLNSINNSLGVTDKSLNDKSVNPLSETKATNANEILNKSITNDQAT